MRNQSNWHAYTRCSYECFVIIYRGKQFCRLHNFWMYGLIFLKDFPLVYPLLAHTDIYLGDMSSIGYDFLPFNKPMFFLNKQKRDPKTDRGLYLFRCGVDIKPDAYPLIYKFIETRLEDDQENFSAIRKEVYDYTFGEERTFADIKADIIAAYNEPLILS